MKRIIVTGANGQLGMALRETLSQLSDFETLFTDIDSLDITDSNAIETAFRSFKPDYVINAAAYTAVENAESEPERCRKLNAEAAGLLAQEAARIGARMIHISTDYVFDGTGTRPYKETDTPCPVSVYGKTKLEGEQLVQKALPKDAVILRTAWLYSVTGRNFVKTMLTLAAERDEIGVVADQWGSPTYAPMLAEAIAAVLTAKRWKPGVYHVTGSGRTTWYDFTRAIFREAGIDRKCTVRPLTSDEYPSAVRRPAYSVLDTSLFQSTYNFQIPDWQTGLHNFFIDFSV